MFPVPCEAIFNLHEAVERSALVGVNGSPVIIIERTPTSSVSDSDLTVALLNAASKNPLTEAIQLYSIIHHFQSMFGTMQRLIDQN